MYINQYLDSYIAPLFHRSETIVTPIQCNHNNINQDWSKSRCLKGGGWLWAQMSGGRRVVHQRILASEN